MSESISKNNELENEMTLEMSYFWYSDERVGEKLWVNGIVIALARIWERSGSVAKIL